MVIYREYYLKFMDFIEENNRDLTYEESIKYYIEFLN